MQGARLTRLITATLGALGQDSPQSPDAAGGIESIARLALIARGRLAQGSPEGRAALRAGFLHAARDIMIRDLHRPDLTSATVAAELAISLRQVHVLFEPTGLSFTRSLTAMRLKEARQAAWDHAGAAGRGTSPMPAGSTASRRSTAFSAAPMA